MENPLDLLENPGGSILLLLTWHYNRSSKTKLPNQILLQMLGKHSKQHSSKTIKFDFIRS